jgi:hypothetical protein
MNSNGEHIYNVAARLISPQDIGLGKDKLRNAAKIAENKIASIQFVCLSIALLSSTFFIASTIVWLFELNKQFNPIINPFFQSIIAFLIFIVAIALPSVIQFYEPFRKWFRLSDICKPPELDQLFDALKKGCWEAFNAKGENIPEYLFDSEWRIFLVSGPSYRHRRNWVRHFLSKAYTDDILVRPLEPTTISWAFCSSTLIPSNDNSVMSGC